MTPARTYAVLALGVAAFTVYGSLVPFDLVSMSWADAVARFEAALGSTLRSSSKTDVVANVLLGVPLGFCLLGAVRADRPGFGGSLVAALVAWPWCISLAVGVEFAQVFAPGRWCSAADIASQSFGSFLGLGGWLLFGPRFTTLVRRIWTDPRAGGTVGKVLLAYLGLILVVQMLPLDLSPSPKMVYDRFKNGQVELVPFAKWQLPRADYYAKSATACELVGLFLILGLLLARVPGRITSRWSGWPAVALAGFGFALFTECGQLFVSREPSITDALWGTLGVVSGWLVGKILQTIRSEPGVALEPALILGQLWFALLAVICWQPFNFASGVRRGGVNWVPFADSTAKNYLAGLDEILLKSVLYLPLGVLIASYGVTAGGRGRVVAAAGAGVLAAAVLECGQVFLPGRYPSMTDLVLAALGASAAAVVTQRLRNPGGPA